LFCLFVFLFYFTFKGGEKVKAKKPIKMKRLSKEKVKLGKKLIAKLAGKDKPRKPNDLRDIYQCKMLAEVSGRLVFLRGQVLYYREAKRLATWLQQWIKWAEWKEKQDERKVEKDKRTSKS
jgi:hypothetical protein